VRQRYPFDEVAWQTELPPMDKLTTTGYDGRKSFM